MSSLKSTIIDASLKKLRSSSQRLCSEENAYAVDFEGIDVTVLCQLCQLCLLAAMVLLPRTACSFVSIRFSRAIRAAELVLLGLRVKLPGYSELPELA